MRLILKLTLILWIIGCNNAEEPFLFNSIDYSTYWGYYKSIKILNNGKVYIYYKDFNEDTYYYFLNLKKIQLDSLIESAKALYTIKIDTSYRLSRVSGIDFSLLINSNRGNLMTTYSGPCPYVVKGFKLQPLFDFVDYLNRISFNLMKSADSNFVFKSQNKLNRTLPPHLQELNKFK